MVLLALYLLVSPAVITGLYRYAVKGLSGDALERVILARKGEAFPDDRRFALLQASKEFRQEWLHKENFLCAFTAPEILAKLESSYSIHVVSNENLSRGFPCDIVSSALVGTKRMLVVRERATGELLLNVDLSNELGRNMLANFLSYRSGQQVKCITSMTSNEEHDFQFGNTSSGWKQRRDTRTVHIINQATVRQLSKAISGREDFLAATRFRPNIVIDGPPAWSEFDWVGTGYLAEPQSGLRLSIISKTVRCKGVSVDPLNPDDILDVPQLLMEHFPNHGPYLGVYAVVDAPGSMSLGDKLRVENL